MSRRSGMAHLARSWFERETVDVARALLGQHVVSRLGDALTSGRIVETEAYRGADDLASHAARHRTGRYVTMRGQAGIAYIYRSYGIHAMLNVIAHSSGETGAVLIRALEPIDGIETMRARRGSLPDRRLCSGPGNLCVALAIRLEDHGVDLSTSDHLWLAAGDVVSDDVVQTGPRIGISRAVDAPWRFFLGASPHVSATRRGTPLAKPDPLHSNPLVSTGGTDLPPRSVGR